MTTPPRAAVTEHRLALVMNGGVSLAVWMGGVAQEIDTLRRASNGFDPSGPTPALFAKWAEIAAAAENGEGRAKGRRFTVDVIAGTSAGGLNGVLLAAAIGKGVPLSGLRDLWMEAPALTDDRLLRPQVGDPTSILNGDYFHDQIAGAIGTLSRAADIAPGAGRQLRPADVSLTVTATALGGQPRRVRDRNGSTFLQQDHRRRYGFRRVGQRFDYGIGGPSFRPAPIQDLTLDDELGLAARATASFPAVFAPVKESPTLRDQRLWPTWDTGDATEYLADGGILDNSPFETVLDAIAAQPVEDAWVRTLCFIVPSADEIGHPVHTDPTLPPPWTSVVGAAIGDPREADLRDDVEMMHDLVRAGRTSYDIDRLRLLLDEAPAPTPGGRTPFDVAVLLATDGLELYRVSRRAAAVYDALEVAARELPQAFLDPQVRITSDDIGHDPHPWVADAFPTDLPTSWTWGIFAAQRLVTLLVRSIAEEEGLPYNALRGYLSTLGAKLTAVRGAIGREIRSAVTASGADDLPSPAAMVAILDAAFTDLAVPATVAGLVIDAVTAYGGVTGHDPVRVLQAALCVEVVNGAGGSPLDLQTRPRFDFLRLGIGTAPPMLDAAFRGPDGGPVAPKSDILYGSRLSHFAAFGDQSWREWDWMWGRLHAAVQLVSLMGFEDEVRDRYVNDLTTLIVGSETWSLEDLLPEIRRVLALTPDDLIADMAQRDLISQTVDAVFDLVASDAPTEPAVPRQITVVGKGLSGLGHLSGKLVQFWLRHR